MRLFDDFFSLDARLLNFGLLDVKPLMDGLFLVFGLIVFHLCHSLDALACQLANDAVDLRFLRLVRVFQAGDFQSEVIIVKDLLSLDSSTDLLNAYPHERFALFRIAVNLVVEHLVPVVLEDSVDVNRITGLQRVLIDVLGRGRHFGIDLRHE